MSASKKDYKLSNYIIDLVNICPFTPISLAFSPPSYNRTENARSSSIIVNGKEKGKALATSNQVTSKGNVEIEMFLQAQKYKNIKCNTKSD